MKFKSIIIKDDPVLGDVSLDFELDSNEIADNIVFIGENGTGKTHLLELISSFFEKNNSYINNTVREYVVILTDNEMKSVQKSLSGVVTFLKPNRCFRILHNFAEPAASGRRVRVWYMSNEGPSAIVTHEIGNSISFLSNEVVKSIFRIVYSTIDVNYIPNKIANITSSDIDVDKASTIKSSRNLATEIKQLFVDIQSSDANDLFQWCKIHPGEAPTAAVQAKRMNRFISAYSRIFGSLNYDRTQTQDGGQEVFFQKGNNSVRLDDLSSGEKQIVFRGGFLLANQQSTIGAPILIDEPEISLHPLWQKKAFDFYRKLSVASNGRQTSQVFFATHSEYVLESAFNDSDDTIIILCKEGQFSKFTKNKGASIFPTPTAAELRYKAFGIISVDLHIQLYAYIQKISKTTKIKGCDEFIMSSHSYNPKYHEKISKFKQHEYHTISTFIRNAIDHPGEGKDYTEDELRKSVDLMVSIIKESAT